MSAVRWLVRAHLPMLVARLAVGGVFVWYGVNKVRAPVAFLKALREYDLLPTEPPWYLTLTAIVLPWLEIVAGALVLLGAQLRAAGGLLLAATLVFTAAIAVRGAALAASGSVPLCDVAFDCGCGVGEVRVCWKLAENVLLLFLVALVTFSSSRLFAVGGPRDRTVCEGRGSPVA
ncbi:MAG: DoxX family protein [Planctomycetes bacterium]|nr:DoxX family protein [Planctomycetota bacterium]